jgi:putative DNA primase/helicase
MILPDADNPGRAHANNVACSVLAVAASVRVLELPSLADKEDVSDWLGRGS